MSINYSEYIESQTNYKLTNLHDINYDNIVDLFGDYLTYNQIIKFKNNKLNEIDIASKIYENNEGIMTIWINKEYVKDIHFKNCGFELIYKIEQIS